MSIPTASRYAHCNRVPPVPLGRFLGRRVRTLATANLRRQARATGPSARPPTETAVDGGTGGAKGVTRASRGDTSGPAVLSRLAGDTRGNSRAPLSMQADIHIHGTSVAALYNRSRGTLVPVSGHTSFIEASRASASASSVRGCAECPETCDH
eukprot:6666462-Pyramimonas_sp.AAC.1